MNAIELISTLGTFFQRNPWVGAVILLGLALSTLKIPKPDRAKHPVKYVIWTIWARAIFTAWDRWGVTVLKLPGTIVPRPEFDDTPPSTPCGTCAATILVSARFCPFCGVRRGALPPPPPRKPSPSAQLLEVVPMRRFPLVLTLLVLPGCLFGQKKDQLDPARYAANTLARVLNAETDRLARDITRDSYAAMATCQGSAIEIRACRASMVEAGFTKHRERALKLDALWVIHRTAYEALQAATEKCQYDTKQDCQLATLSALSRLPEVEKAVRELRK